MEQTGHNVCFLQFEKDELPCDYEWVEGVVCNGLFLSHPIKKFSNLKYIQLTSAGFDRVPMDYVKEHGIKINNARGVYSIPMEDENLIDAYREKIHEFIAKNKRNQISKMEINKLFYANSPRAFSDMIHLNE